MKRLRTFLRNNFGFSKSEINGTIILIGLMMLFIMAPFIAGMILPDTRHSFYSEKKALDSLAAILEKEIERKNIKRSTYPQKKDSVKMQVTKTSSKSNFKNQPKKITQNLKQFDLNKVDSTTLRSIKGIGKVLSSRIVKYRDLLGGIINYQQLNEVYGLNEDVIGEIRKYSFIKDGFQPNQININSLSAYELSSHPYIDYRTGKIITLFREQHGSFSRIDELQRIEIITEEWIQKISPYIDFSLPETGQ